MIIIMITKTYYDSYGKSMIADRVRLNPSRGLSMACLHAPRGSQSLLQRDKQARGCACCAETILLQRSVQQATLHCLLSPSPSLHTSIAHAGPQEAHTAGNACARAGVRGITDGSARARPLTGPLRALAPA